MLGLVGGGKWMNEGSAVRRYMYGVLHLTLLELQYPTVVMFWLFHSRRNAG